MKKGDFQSFTSPEANTRGHPRTAQQEKLGFYAEQKSYFGNVNSSRIQRQAVSWATTGRSLWQPCWEKTHKNRWLCSCCFLKLDPSISPSDIHNAVSASTPLIQANLSPDPKQASSPVIRPLNFQPCSCCIYPWWNSVSDYQAQETPLFGKHLGCLVPSIWVNPSVRSQAGCLCCCCKVHVYLILYACLPQPPVSKLPNLFPPVSCLYE